MNGPQSFPGNPPAPEPTPTPTPSPAKLKEHDYTDEELGKADAILKEARNFDGSFGIRFSRAADALGYGTYTGVPERVRSAVSHLAAEARRRAKEKKDAVLARKKEAEDKKRKADDEADEIRRRADEASALAEQQLREAEERRNQATITAREDKNRADQVSALAGAQLENVEEELRQADLVERLHAAEDEWWINATKDPAFLITHGDPEVEPEDVERILKKKD